MDDLIDKIIDARPNVGDPGRRRRIVASGVTILALATGMTSLATGAVFTDTQRVDDSVFTTGTVDIATDPTATIVQSPNLAPGDTVFGLVTVRNSGSLEYRYALTDFASNEDGKSLHSQLQMAVYNVPNAGTCNAQGTANLTALGAKSGIATTEEPLFGNNEQGIDTGDRVLPSGGNELLCMRIDLPLDTPNTFQAATSSLSFNFYAEQTANND